MRVAVLTTSYPRDDDDYAGRFIADAVEQLRARGVEVDVVRYRDFGLTYGAGVVANVRRRPWVAPFLLLSMLRAVRRARADLVHAHWLAAALVARFGGKPFVVTLHGTGTAGRFSDVELARRRPGFVRWLLRPARATICVSETVARAIRAAGVASVVVIPNGVRIPERVAVPVEPPEVLYVGRLSPEKNIGTLVEACGDLNLVVAGDGPLRDLVPNGLGAVPQAEVEHLLDRASVFVAPCDTEGFGLAAAEALAHGRPVVAAAGGALLELVEDDVTGVFVPPRDAPALRRAVESLLADPARRAHLGDAAHERARERFGWDGVAWATVEVYRQAVPS
ncbi:MAG TPA: glycosyltransferase family 4 protein [Gaiellaceae bacterium]|nr:glycosyltransferase family 4 protein [Gaiellaceae bacterium]